MKKILMFLNARLERINRRPQERQAAKAATLERRVEEIDRLLRD